MDFRTLQERLYSGQVTTVSQFKWELDLIWDNCVAYNGDQAVLSQIAIEVKKYIDEIWNECEHPAPSDALEKLQELGTVLDNLADDIYKFIKIESRPVILPVKKVPKPPPKPAAPEPPPVKTIEVVPNHQQRKLIADKLSRASVPEMRKAWDLLRPFMDKSVQERQALSLNDLPDPVLIELKKIVLP
jgi:hypothetical protein